MLNNFNRRKLRNRSSISTNNKSDRPRIVPFRSNKNFYLQLISVDGKVISSSSTLKMKDQKSSGMKFAETVAIEFAKSCISSGVKEVVFDKGPYSYSGRIKVAAESCRKSGLVF